MSICDSRKYDIVPAKPYPYAPSGGGGGGTPQPQPSPSSSPAHLVVSALPATTSDIKKGVEYVVLTDLNDVNTFVGTYVYHKKANKWVRTSGSAGGGGGTPPTTGTNIHFQKTTKGWVALSETNEVLFEYEDKVSSVKYTFEQTSEGFVAKEDGTPIFAYSNPTATVYEFTKTDEYGGFYVKKNGVVVYTNNTTKNIENANDITQIKTKLETYLEDTLEACPEVFKLTKNGTKLKLCLKEGLKFGRNVYRLAAGTLSIATTIGAITHIQVSQVEDLEYKDIEVGKTLIYDAEGNVGVVSEVAGNNIKTLTITISSKARGVRLGAVEKLENLPADVATAIGAGINWQTPAQSDYAYVRDHNGKLAEFVVKKVKDTGEIEWDFSHYINAGNYVVDLKRPDGSLIPRNPDGTVTLPEDKGIMEIKDHEGGRLTITDGSVTLPKPKVLGVKTNDGNLLENNDGYVKLPAPSGKIDKVVLTGVGELPIENKTVTLPQYPEGEKNVIERIYKSDGTALPVVNKAVTLPEITGGGGGGASKWEDIIGRPNSNPERIDGAVAKAHTHPNKATLDLLGDSDGNLTYRGVKFNARTEFVATNNDLPNEGVEGVIYVVEKDGRAKNYPTISIWKGGAYHIMWKQEHETPPSAKGLKIYQAEYTRVKANSTFGFSVKSNPHFAYLPLGILEEKAGKENIEKVVADFKREGVWNYDKEVATVENGLGVGLKVQDMKAELKRDEDHYYHEATLKLYKFNKLTLIS